MPEIAGPVHDIASFGWTAKPEPLVYDEVLRREAVADPGTILFAEDRSENLGPARARGIRCVWIDEDAFGDWTESVNGSWDAVPWHWKLKTLSDLPLLLLPRLGAA